MRAALRSSPIAASARTAAERSLDRPGFVYDTGFSGPSYYDGSTSDPIDTSGVTNPAPQAVYQTWRAWYDFGYTLGNLTPGTSYMVRLDFADPSSTDFWSWQMALSPDGS